MVGAALALPGCNGALAVGAPELAPPAAPAESAESSPIAEPTVTIASLTSSRSIVAFGETATLRWVVEGNPEAVLLNGESVLGKSSIDVVPTRRQKFTLEVRRGTSRSSGTIEVAARGIDRLAGDLAAAGSLDGPLTLASFETPTAIASIGGGAFLVVDGSSCTVRRVTPTEVTTLAGRAGACDLADGRGAEAHFARPVAIAVDDAGLAYVVDGGGNALRTIDPSGLVTTIVGDGKRGANDGPGALARLSSPNAVVTLPSGDVLVVDTGNHALRRVAPDRTVTTLTSSFEVPFAAARGSAGNVLVVDGCRIQTVDVATGTASAYAGGECTEPRDGTRAAAVFGLIGGIVADPSGTVYVSDASTRTIRRISTMPDSVSTVAGNAQAQWSPLQDFQDGVRTYATFGTPLGLTFAADGSLVVADSEAHLVRAVSLDGVVGTIAGRRLQFGSQDGAAGTNRTGGYVSFARTSGGDFVVADAWFNSIRVMTSEGALRTIAGGAAIGAVADGPKADARFAGPVGLATGDNGEVFVAEISGVIRRVDAEGRVTTLAGIPGVYEAVDGPRGVGSFHQPLGLVRDRKGNLFIPDAPAGRIRVVRPDGSIETFAGGTPTGQVLDGVGGAARMTWPRALAIDSEDNLYFADGAYVLRKITPDALVTTIAGTFNVSGHTDGPARKASFSGSIRGIAVDAGGNLFVSDSGNHVVRKITREGVVSTVVGTYGTRGLRAGPLPGSLFDPAQLAVTAAGDLLISCGAGIVQVTAP